MLGHRHVRTYLIVAVLAATFLAGSVAVSPPASAASSLELELARYHNIARDSRGLRRLSLDTTLSDKARAHSRVMARRAQIFHSSSLPRAYGSGEGAWTYLGENVGVGGSMRSLHDAFMRSTSHRANILKRPYRRMGIGVVRSGSRSYVTVAFLG